MSRIFRAVAVLLVVFAGFVAWYRIAANYDYKTLSGTYTLNQAGEKCILRLRPDETFTEELERGGTTTDANGHWHRYGEAHASFSHEFILLSGQAANAENEAHGQFEKAFGMFPSLTLAPIPGGPKLHRELIR